MFASHKLKPILEEMLKHIRAQKRMVGCSIVSTIEKGVATIQTTKLGKTLLEDLGPRGWFSFDYELKAKKLSLELFFSYKKGDAEFDILSESLDCFEDVDDGLERVELFADNGDGTSSVRFDIVDMHKKDLACEIDRILGIAFNWLDIVWESIEEEC